MSDSNFTGEAFGVQPAPFTVVPESLQAPVNVEEQIPTSAVPAAFRGRLTDRLMKRQPRQKIVDLGDGDLILVRGMDAYAVEAMQERLAINTDPDADPDEAEKPKKITEAQPGMLRTMCFDPEDGSSVFGSGQQIGVDEQGQPVIDGWTDHQINKLPMDVINQLMTAVNYVMGRGTEPGKDSPSTGDTDSSSS